MTGWLSRCAEPPDVPDVAGSASGKRMSYSAAETASAQQPTLPFPATKIGMNSNHGVKPVRKTPASPTRTWVTLVAERGARPCSQSGKFSGTTAKINQDRGVVSYPFCDDPQQMLLAVYDGHGLHGSAWKGPPSLTQDTPQQLASCRAQVEDSPPCRHGELVSEFATFTYVDLLEADVENLKSDPVECMRKNMARARAPRPRPSSRPRLSHASPPPLGRRPPPPSAGAAAAAQRSRSRLPTGPALAGQVKCDDLIRKKRTVPSQDSGSTAIVALLSGNTITTACVGDSRCVKGTKGTGGRGASRRASPPSQPLLCGGGPRARRLWPGASRCRAGPWLC